MIAFTVLGLLFCVCGGLIAAWSVLSALFAIANWFWTDVLWKFRSIRKAEKDIIKFREYRKEFGQFMYGLESGRLRIERGKLMVCVDDSEKPQKVKQEEGIG